MERLNVVVNQCSIKLELSNNKKVYFEGGLDGDNFDMKVFENPKRKNEGVDISEDERKALLAFFQAMQILTRTSQKDEDYITVTHPDGNQFDVDLKKYYERGGN